MSSFKKSLAALAGLSFLIGLLALTTPTRTRGQGQGGGLSLPFDKTTTHDGPAFAVSNHSGMPTASGVFGRGAIGVAGEAKLTNGFGVAGYANRGVIQPASTGRPSTGTAFTVAALTRGVWSAYAARASVISRRAASSAPSVRPSRACPKLPGARGSQEWRTSGRMRPESTVRATPVSPASLGAE
jgi:hypothetical protein